MGQLNSIDLEIEIETLTDTCKSKKKILSPSIGTQCCKRDQPPEGRKQIREQQYSDTYKR